MDEELEKLTTIAKAQNTTPAAIAADAIRDHIKEFKVEYSVSVNR